ncbi:polyprenyl diphosphate synthase [Acinetobacter sp. A3.8]|uniref:Ditrans,polycis-undecaprenyl-diphosphate synthase ((2E,6E)-farnesyl-diphosphate specific) n=1 Tax=Acinetobacter sedimenti TaxID=2919922 RepID=A0A9X1WXT9_9GAMM|nr:polyprenyl diphosphate synthase [Acinetobacter sedimenti]MCJ8146956.1 polyprenyl diphosphate synthase [Acinetobacter sedimenti]
MISASTLPKHVAIIMDGNNRYGKRNHLDSGGGHRAGKDRLDPLVEHCRAIGIQSLTVFAFSSENWNRPESEVALLMQLLEETVIEQKPRMIKHQIALRFIGDRSKLSARLQQLMLDAEQETAQYTAMTLTIAISYGGMWDMVQAAKSLAQQVQQNQLTLDEIDEHTFHQQTCLNDLAPVDVLIRTGGDFRLSNFLLWQTAYAELFFTETLWPDFSVEEFDRILKDFAQRERRFGKTSEQVQAIQYHTEN